MARTESTTPSTYYEFFRPFRAQWATLKEVASGEVHGRALFGIEYLFLVTVCAFLLVMPSQVVRAISEMVGGSIRKVGIEIYAIAKPVFAIFILFTGRYESPIWTLIVAVLLFDLYLSLSSLVFLRHFFTGPSSRGRSVILLGINFVEAVSAYAVFYGYFGSVAHMVATAASGLPASIDILYFSCATAVAVGYGDLLVVTGIGKGIAIIQMLSSLGFVSIFLTTFVSDFAGNRSHSMLLHPHHDKDETHRG
ncbi:MAG TPA: ion channel [Chthoniobacteraceae bacterium]|nr:ion channel [Chthoniobacteraceae bacterium]